MLMLRVSVEEHADVNHHHHHQQMILTNDIDVDVDRHVEVHHHKLSSIICRSVAILTQSNETEGY